MPTLPNNYLLELHSQHSLQSTDLLTIYQLATLENIDESFESFSFDELLGLTVYLFVTTQSQNTREQLSRLLSKFGSAVVLPLLRILSKKDFLDPESLSVLALKSLNQMALYPLAIGLDQVLNQDIEDDLKTFALQVFSQLQPPFKQSNVAASLSQVLSETTLQLVEDFSRTETNLPIYWPIAKSDQQSKQSVEITEVEYAAV